MTQKPDRSHIDDIVGLIDKVLGPDDGSPTPRYLDAARLAPAIAPRTRRTPRTPPSWTRYRGPRGAVRTFGVRDLANLTFDDLVEFIGRRTECQLANNTAIARRRYSNNDGYHVTLHHTVILSFGRFADDGGWAFTVNSGGYKSTTTKQRLNALLAHTNYRIFSQGKDDDGEARWFITTPDGDVEFEDGLTFEVSPS